MSPTSYRTAPPRIAEVNTIASTRRTVKEEFRVPMFYGKIFSLFAGAFLEFAFLGLAFWISSRQAPPGRGVYRAGQACLLLGAALVMVHALLARDLVLLVGQGLAVVLFYRWFRAISY